MKKLLIVLSLLLVPTIVEAEYYSNQVKLKLSNSTCEKYCGRDFVYDAEESYASIVCKKYPRNCGKNCYVEEWDEKSVYLSDLEVDIDCYKPLKVVKKRGR